MADNIASELDASRMGGANSPDEADAQTTGTPEERRRWRLFKAAFEMFAYSYATEIVKAIEQTDGSTEELRAVVDEYFRPAGIGAYSKGIAALEEPRPADAMPQNKSEAASEAAATASGPRKDAERFILAFTEIAGGPPSNVNALRSATSHERLNTAIGEALAEVDPTISSAIQNKIPQITDTQVAEKLATMYDEESGKLSAIDVGSEPPAIGFTPDIRYLGDYPEPGAQGGTFVPGVGVDPTDAQISAAQKRVDEIQRLRKLDVYRRRQREVDFDTVTNVIGQIDDGKGFVPRYIDGEQMQFAWYGQNQIRRIQERMVAGGLLSPDGYLPGVWDGASTRAMANLMALSNNTGVTWETQLTTLNQNMTKERLLALYGKHDEESAKRAFTAPAFREPDYAALAQAVKQTTRQRLRREPTDAEMARLTAQLQTDYRAQYEAEVAAARSEFNAQTAALETGEAQSAGTVRQVDPGARFLETFDKMYRPEERTMEQSDDTIQRKVVTTNAMSMFDSLIGG